MRKEIDILERAAGKKCILLNKNSHELWTSARLAEARVAGQFQDKADLLPPDHEAEVNVSLPGNWPDPSALAGPLVLRPVGQTEHFLILATSEARPATQAVG